ATPAGDGSRSTATQSSRARPRASRRASARSRGADRGSRHPASDRPRPKASRRTARSGPHPLHCSSSSAMLPANYVTIVRFLIRHGYTRLAAAGIAGNIYQESKGNPESVGSGGGGLIGFTPLPSGLVTGNPAADLRTQLNAILTYNQQWSQYIPALNGA